MKNTSHHLRPSNHIRLALWLMLMFSVTVVQAEELQSSRPLFSYGQLDNMLSRNSFKASNGMTMPYRLYVPKNISPHKTYPLLVFLHGRGERGTDNTAKMFAHTGLFNGQNSILSPANRQKYPSIIVVPQCSDLSADQEWAHWIGNSPQQPFAGLGKDGSYQQHTEASTSGAAAVELIERLIAQYQVDQQRVYLTGISMGGFGTWEFTARHPQLFAAAVPMAGFSDPQTAERVKHIPFWVFHGSNDEYNPVQGSRNMTDKLKTLGGNVRYTELQGLKHSETFKEAWNNADILPWLFSQKKPVD